MALSIFSILIFMECYPPIIPFLLDQLVHCQPPRTISEMNFRSGIDHFCAVRFSLTQSFVLVPIYTVYTVADSSY